MSWLYSYLIIVNALLFILIAIDKQRAIHQRYRISERTLLMLGLLGGGMAGWLAMLLFRHKTRKKKFHMIYWLGIAWVMFFLLKNSIITSSL